MRIGKKKVKDIIGKDIWTKVASDVPQPIIVEPKKIVINAEENYLDTARFNGSSSYIEISDSGDWDIFANVTDNWTIDFFLKVDSDNANQRRIIWQQETTDKEWYIGVNNGGIIEVCNNVGSTNSPETVTGGELNFELFSHIIIYKSSNVVSIYQDGKQVGYGTITNTGTLAGALRIGYGIGSNPYLEGNIDALRIYYGNPYNLSPNGDLTDKYRLPITPVVSDTNTRLLVHFNSNLIDDTGRHTLSGTDIQYERGLIVEMSGYDRIVTLDDDVEVSDSQSKFGANSLYFNGNGLCKVKDDGSFDLVANKGDNWTIDFWVYHLSNSSNQTYICQRPGDDYYWQLGFDTTNGVMFECQNGTSFYFSCKTNFNVPLNTWTHICFTKVGNRYAIYINGSQMGYSLINNEVDFTEDLIFGANWYAGGYTNFLNGYMDGFELVRDNVYEADPQSDNSDTITVPTSAPTMGDTSNVSYPSSIKFQVDSLLDEQYRIVVFLVNDDDEDADYILKLNGNDVSVTYRGIEADGTNVVGLSNTDTKCKIVETLSANNKAVLVMNLITKRGMDKTVILHRAKGINETDVEKVGDITYRLALLDIVTSIEIVTDKEKGIGVGSYAHLYKLQ